MDASVWVALSFVAFIGVLLYAKVPCKIRSSLQAQQNQIKTRLEEARLLRNEAEALFQQAEQRLKNVQKEAEEFLRNAQQQAEGIARLAEENAQALIARRTKLAEEKILQAETQAVSQIKTQIIDYAINAVNKSIDSQFNSDRQTAFSLNAISELSRTSL
jgi:F-type H+-transporting ATPase subunit b